MNFEIISQRENLQDRGPGYWAATKSIHIIITIHHLLIISSAEKS
jgi:hypothetical protein